MRFSQYQVVRARKPASFLAGKGDSRRHSTRIFSENVVLANTIIAEHHAKGSTMGKKI